LPLKKKEINSLSPLSTPQKESKPYTWRARMFFLQPLKSNVEKGEEG